MSTIKERGILFSAPMVRALLDGSKTQTRRVIKPQPSQSSDTAFLGADNIWRFSHPTVRCPVSHEADDVRCPYGVVGDRLWVRETWLHHEGGNTYDAAGGVADSHDAEVIYRASCEHYPGPWRPSIFMPRWASRMTLEVTGVRVERLQDISEGDAWAEGCKRGDADDAGGFFPAEEIDPSGIGHRGWDNANDWYADLWESINGADSWDKNPWVWVVEFNRIKP